MNSREINLIKELFKGREDVFAIHWQKGTKSGYMPACHYDPYMYRLHKINGGTFNSYKGKTYLPFTDQQIARHLNGEQLIGIYPLLKDHTSWFIVADFDQHNWTEESQAFVGGCFNKGIPAYLERSRSGNGGHVWVFFNQPYPAIRSRKIILSILEETGIFSAFDKSLSFDRLFPNQDVLSGKGFGNLIALPLHKTAREHGNSCFVDEHFTPYKNQWGFLSSVQKVTTVHLDEVFESLTTKQRSSATTTRIISDQLYITLNRSVQLNRSGMTPEIIHFLKEELHFANPEYFIKKKTGKSTHNTKRYFKFIEETENQVILPRGFTGKLIRYCRQKKIDFEFFDERKKLPFTLFSTHLTLRPHQNIATAATSKKEFGVIVAPPGSGKMVIALKIIAKKQQPTLIIVHCKQLSEQWADQTQAFLGIPKNEMGKIGQGKAKVGEKITVAMIQSLDKLLEKQEIKDLDKRFGIIIIDECRQNCSVKPFQHYLPIINMG